MTNREKALEIAQLCNGCLEGKPAHPCNGCSSCEQRGVYYGAIKMAQWKEQQMIEKTIEFFNNNSHVNCGWIDDAEIDKFADEYEKYMKGE